ncbi:hypothetical protein TNIN_147401 [Trichonephila inaurata madagascariensis]|uniref:Uncharacterized protein n=1 Tax=Trichonephila inaurata madagascariensis TaxID=2747483 RepID=A0A8X6YS89_9ARAC|nr:hypothetical protein TNIN_147401 [Trichonephila inaurata madagascariensis]
MMVGNHEDYFKRKYILCVVFLLVRSIKWISASYFYNSILAHFIATQLIVLFSVIGLMIDDECKIAGKLLVMCAMLFYVNSFDLFFSSLDNPLLTRLVTLSWIPLFILFEVMLLNDSIRATDVLDVCLKLGLIPFMVATLVYGYPYVIQYI